MKIKIKFISFFSLGLLLFLVYMSLVMMFSFDVILPALNLTDNTLAFLIVFIASFLSGGIFFSNYFVQPIISMISLIGELSLGNLSPCKTWHTFRKSNGKLKSKYWLYQELISHLELLADRLNQSEQERQKLEEAKQNWIRGISHDLKTPLSYIIGYSSLLLSPDHEWTKEEHQHFLSHIHDKGTYIETLIHNLNLSFRLNDSSKPIPLQLSSFDLIDLLEKLIAYLLNQDTEETYSISLHALDDHLLIEADEHLLYRMLLNLISNSIQHNPPQTEITVEVKRSTDNHIGIVVKDNGLGMSQEKLSHLFESYYSHNASGTYKHDYVSGLGMSIVKSIIEVHQGTLQVESTLNVGTTFMIALPLTQLSTSSSL